MTFLFKYTAFLLSYAGNYASPCIMHALLRSDVFWLCALYFIAASTKYLLFWLRALVFWIW